MDRFERKAPGARPRPRPVCKCRTWIVCSDHYDYSEQLRRAPGAIRGARPAGESCLLPGPTAATLARPAATAAARRTSATACRPSILHKADAPPVQLGAVQLLDSRAHVRVRREFHHAGIAIGYVDDASGKW